MKMLRLIFILSTITCIEVVNSEDFTEQFNDIFHNRKFQRFVDEDDELENEILKDSRSKHTVCRTEECFRVAAELWESINKSADPCENFYDYACGSWSINNPIPPTEMIWDNFAKTEKKIEERIRDLLEESIQVHDILPVKQLKKFYRSCMNTDAIEKMGLKRLQAILVRNGGWPMAMELEEWDSEVFTWQLIDKNYLKFIGLSAFFTITVKQDDRETDSSNYIDERSDETVKMILTLGTPKLPNVLMKDPSKRFNITSLYETGYYAKLITEVALIFAKESGSLIDRNQLATDVQNMIDFEKKIRHESENSKYSSKIMLLEDLQTFLNNLSYKSQASKINLKSTISDYFADVNIEVNGDEEIRIRIGTLEYLQNMAKIVDETEPRTIVNYIHWNFLTNSLFYTTEHMRKLKYDLQKELTEVKEETPRSEMCVNEIGMEHAISYLFVKKYFKSDMREHAEEIFSGVKKAIIKHILKADWLDDEMRKTQLQKIYKMKREIGFPDWYNNASTMEHYYSGMVIGNQFLENVFSYEKFSQRKLLRTLRTRVREDLDEFDDPTIVNAFFNYHLNTLTLPAGEFQLEFYSPTLPQIMSYGSIGSTVGHEVSHSFDVDGMIFPYILAVKLKSNELKLNNKNEIVAM